MRIETSLVDRQGQNICGLPGEKTNKHKKNRKRNKKSMPSVVQKLFETCKEVFAVGGAGIVPSPGDVERLRSVLGEIAWLYLTEKSLRNHREVGDLAEKFKTSRSSRPDSMKPEDVGLAEDMAYFQMIDSKGTHPIIYLHLYDCDRFSIGIFCLPQGGVIPLHNHPGMTVFSRLLFGSMHIKSYDWVTDVSNDTKENRNSLHYQSPGKGIRLAKVKNDSVFTAQSNTSILYPAAGGNMHCFTAVTSCAVLDVLGPPYSDPQGRHCTYYQDFPYASFSGDAGLGYEEGREGYAWLEEREKPEDFVVLGAMYRGPKIVEK